MIQRGNTHFQLCMPVLLLMSFSWWNGKTADKFVQITSFSFETVFFPSRKIILLFLFFILCVFWMVLFIEIKRAIFTAFIQKKNRKKSDVVQKRICSLFFFYNVFSQFRRRKFVYLCLNYANASFCFKIEDNFLSFVLACKWMWIPIITHQTVWIHMLI